MGCAPSAFLPPWVQQVTALSSYSAASSSKSKKSVAPWATLDTRQFISNSIPCISDDGLIVSCHNEPHRLLCADTSCTLQQQLVLCADTAACTHQQHVQQHKQQQEQEQEEKQQSESNGGGSSSSSSSIPDNTLVGLRSTWVTPFLLAMAQPSNYVIAKYHIVHQLQQYKVVAIINLQVPGEHSLCGYASIQPSSGFTYTPEHFMKNKILYYNFPWRKTSLRSLDYTLCVVQIVDSKVCGGGRVAIHCHSGYQRTCFVIACYLVFSQKCSAADALALVCKQRPHALQPGHLKYIQQFERYVVELRSVYKPQPNQVHQGEKTKFSSLEAFMHQQRKILHGEEARTHYHIPKIVHFITKELVVRTTQDKRVREKLARAFLHELEYEFENDINPILSRDAYIVSMMKSRVDKGDYSDVPELDVHNLLRLLLDWIRQLGQPIIPDWTLTGALSKGEVQSAICELQKANKSAFATFQILACWMYQIIPSKARLTRRLYGGLAHLLLKHTRLHNERETLYNPGFQRRPSKFKERFSIISKVTRGTTRFKPTVLEMEFGLLLEATARYWCILGSNLASSISAAPSSSQELPVPVDSSQKPQILEADDAPKLYASKNLNVTYLNHVEPLLMNRPSLAAEPLSDDLIKNLEETSDLAHPSSLLWV